MQPSNKEDISSTKLVSKIDKSTDTKLVQPCSILVNTLGLGLLLAGGEAALQFFQLLLKLIDFKFFNPLNAPLKLVIAE